MARSKTEAALTLTPDLNALADQALARCELVAGFTEEAGKVTRTFLRAPMRALHEVLSGWMREAGMNARVDAAGNLVGSYPSAKANAPTLLIGSHLDSVPDGGKYDGVLGVMLGVATVNALHLAARRLPFAIDVNGFSEEEGVRYRVPYLGSLAACGKFDLRLLNRIDTNDVTMADAFRAFGLDPAHVNNAAYPTGSVLAYIEAHIEQGAVLESENASLGVVTAIVGQSRLWVEFQGKSGHAGTLPMVQRRDALAAAAEFVLEAERVGRSVEGLCTTIGAISADPGATNVVPGLARLSLDIRHASDPVRERAVASLVEYGGRIADRRGVSFCVKSEQHDRAVRADSALTDLLSESLQAAGHAPLRLVSGAGHDAAMMASVAPMAMLFIRSPGGVSHHPEESVRGDDVRAALGILVDFLDRLAALN